MNFRTSKELIQAYFDDTSHLSQSMIKKILSGIDDLKDDSEKELYYEEKGHFIIGSAVDTILTMGEEVFKEDFHVSLVEKPSGKTLSVLHLVFDNLVHQFNGEGKFSMNDVDTPMVLEACNIEGFQNKWKDETRINAIVKYAEYFNDLCKSFGKQTITFEDFNLINAIVTSFRASKIGWLFDNNHPDMDVYFQVPVYFKIDDTKCKALLDIVVVDHKSKRVGVIDLKTIGEHPINFYKSVTRFRYDIQAAFYIEAIKSWLPEDIADYAISGFDFAVESTTRPIGVVLFPCDEELLKMGREGRKSGFVVTTEGEAVHFNEVSGYKQGIELYEWHVLNGFDKNKDITENDGVLTLGWNRYI